MSENAWDGWQAHAALAMAPAARGRRVQDQFLGLAGSLIFGEFGARVGAGKNPKATKA